MPRANRRRDDAAPLDLGRATAGVAQRASYAGHDWFVRSVGGGAGGGGSYLCPGCQQQIAAATRHVVVWPADGTGGLPGVEQRRHWHGGCWSNRHTRPAQGSWR